MAIRTEGARLCALRLAPGTVVEAWRRHGPFAFLWCGRRESSSCAARCGAGCRAAGGDELRGGIAGAGQGLARAQCCGSRGAGGTGHGRRAEGIAAARCLRLGELCRISEDACDRPVGEQERPDRSDHRLSRRLARAIPAGLSGNRQPGDATRRRGAARAVVGNPRLAALPDARYGVSPDGDRRAAALHRRCDPRDPAWRAGRRRDRRGDAGAGARSVAAQPGANLFRPASRRTARRLDARDARRLRPAPFRRAQARAARRVVARPRARGPSRARCRRPRLSARRSRGGDRARYARAAARCRGWGAADHGALRQRPAAAAQGRVPRRKRPSTGARRRCGARGRRGRGRSGALALSAAGVRVR